MKNALIVAGIIVGVLMIVGVGAAVALAVDRNYDGHSSANSNEVLGSGRGRELLELMHERRMGNDDRTSRMAGGDFEIGDHPLMSHMASSLAVGLGLTSDELIARIESGETPFEIAQEQGLTDEEIQTLFNDSRIAALAAAVEAGDLTQEQADSITIRMENRQNRFFDFGMRGWESDISSTETQP